jgi:hypothetical protein
MPEETPDEARQRVAAHRRGKRSLEELLYRHDPIGIAFGDNPDEYAGEAAAIAARLRETASVEDVQLVVHEEFVRWFDAETAGPVSRYGTIAEEIWAVRHDG